MEFEYKTVGGPDRGKRKDGARTVADRVAAAMEDIIRAQATGGWEYLRTDLVPVEERPSLLGRRRLVHCAVLVFRRPIGGAAAAEPTRAELAARHADIFGGEPKAAEAPRTAPAAPSVAPQPAPPAAAPQPAPQTAPPQPVAAPVARRTSAVPPAPPAGAPALPERVEPEQAAPRPPTPEQLQAAMMVGHPAASWLSAAQSSQARGPQGGEAKQPQTPAAPAAQPEKGGADAPPPLPGMPEGTRMVRPPTNPVPPRPQANGGDAGAPDPRQPPAGEQTSLFTRIQQQAAARRKSGGAPPP